MKRTLICTAARITATTAALVIASAATWAQDFTVQMKDQDGKTSTHYVSRNAVRDVSSAPVETDVIYRLDQGKIIKLNHQQKTYTETTLAEAREQAEKKASERGAQQQQMMAHFGANAAPVVTKLGSGR